MSCPLQRWRPAADVEEEKPAEQRGEIWGQELSALLGRG